jgi:hypothetical protein
MSGQQSISVHGRPLGITPASVSRPATVVLLGLLVAAALMVVARRLAGALANPLEPAVMFATGVLVAMASTAIRIGWLRSTTVCPTPRLDRTIMIVTSLAVLALGIGLCLPNTPLVGMSLLCTLLLAEEVWAWAWYRPKRGQNCFSPAQMPTPVPAGTINSSDPFSAAEVTQRLTRSQTADGAEELSGWVRMAFAAGQRTGNVHVAFCPPFEATPELDVEQIDGPEARIKTAQLMPYGARLDLKLAATAEEPTSVVLQFSARTPQAE